MKEIKIIQAGLEVAPGQMVWFTYQFKHMCDLTEGEIFEEIHAEGGPKSLGRMDVQNGHYCGEWDIPQTWDDFVSLRNEDPRADDPNFSSSGNKVPDAVIFSPGYHSSHISAQTYGQSLHRYLDHYFDQENLSSVHVSLQMMPAPWMIPEKYASDRSERTQLNEYRKNLAIIETVRDHDSVKSVLDFFSSELIFNDVAHHDAVHLAATGIGKNLNTLNAAKMIDAICNN